MIPSIGRIVHISQGDRCLAAIVINVGSNSNYIHFVAFTPAGMFFGTADQSDGRSFRDGEWHEPERV